MPLAPARLGVHSSLPGADSIRGEETRWTIEQPFSILTSGDSMGIRLLHLADLHLGVENYGRPDPLRGYNSRVADFLRCLDAAVEASAEVDLVLIAGDIYKTCQPTPTVQREFADRVKRF